MTKHQACSVCGGLYGLYRVHEEDLCRWCWEVAIACEGRAMRARINRAAMAGDTKEAWRLQEIRLWLDHVRTAE